MGVVLAGVSGVGKTTVARMLAERLGFEYIAVDTSRCMAEPYPLARQLCFAKTIAAWILSRCDRCVFDNSLLNVLAYSAVMLDRRAPATRHALDLLESLALLEKERHTVVVLYVDDPGLLAARQREKAKAGYYRGDRLWRGIDHLRAQDELARFAHSWQLPMINNVTPPEETLGKILEIVKKPIEVRV